jgi:Tol biopolymer transport system component
MKGKIVSGVFAGLLVLSVLLFITTVPAVATITVESIEYLTGEPYCEYTPLWTSDGEKIIYASKEAGWQNKYTYMMDTDGSNKRRIYAGEGRLVGLTDLSPDGRQMLLLKDMYDSGYDTYKVNIDGTGLTPLATEPSTEEQYAHWSPDGSKIVYVRIPWETRDILSEIWIMNADGSNKTAAYYIKP